MRNTIVAGVLALVMTAGSAIALETPKTQSGLFGNVNRTDIVEVFNTYPEITSLTGITANDVKNSPDFTEVGSINGIHYDVSLSNNPTNLKTTRQVGFWVSGGGVMGNTPICTRVNGQGRNYNC